MALQMIALVNSTLINSISSNHLLIWHLHSLTTISHTQPQAGNLFNHCQGLYTLDNSFITSTIAQSFVPWLFFQSKLLLSKFSYMMILHSSHDNQTDKVFKFLRSCIWTNYNLKIFSSTTQGLLTLMNSSANYGSDNSWILQHFSPCKLNLGYYINNNLNTKDFVFWEYGRPHKARHMPKLPKISYNRHWEKSNHGTTIKNT